MGFTMRLFKGSLAFKGQDASYERQRKLCVLGGLILSGLLGTLVLLHNRLGDQDERAVSEA
jgi:Na+/H+ antiporter NhaA